MSWLLKPQNLKLGFDFRGQIRLNVGWLRFKG